MAFLSDDDASKIYQALITLKDFIDDNRELVKSYNINDESLEWNIGNVEICLDRIMLEQHVFEAEHKMHELKVRPVRPVRPVKQK